MTVVPGSERWKELVTAGIVKDGQRNWFLGDAALEIAPMGEDGAHNGSTEYLAQYADDIGVEEHSLREYRRVAAAWRPDNRLSGTAWKVHMLLAADQDSIMPGMKVSEARKALGHAPDRRPSPSAPVTERAETVRQYLSDPEVAKEVAADAQIVTAAMSNPAGHAAAMDVLREEWQEERAEVERKIEADPVSRTMKKLDAVLELGSACAKFSMTVRDIMPQLPARCPEGERFWFGQDLEGLEKATQVIRNWVHSGETTVEEEIAEILGRKHGAAN